MKKINWVRKLTSRKLWTAVASFVSMMIVATGGAENTATQVTALIMAGASVRKASRPERKRKETAGRIWRRIL